MVKPGFRTTWAAPAAVVFVASTTLIAGCGVVLTSIEDQAEAALADAVVGEHELALRQRAADPAALGPTAAEDLADALTGGHAASVVSQAATVDGVEVVTTIGVRVQGTSGLFGYDDATLGACLRTVATVATVATVGSIAAEEGQRGVVTTEAMACPDGVTPLADGAPVEAVTIDVQRLESPVPMSRAEPCFSGSGDCGGGG